jgi:hypothetical protein
MDIVRLVLIVPIALIVLAAGVVSGQGRGDVSQFEADTLKHF